MLALYAQGAVYRQQGKHKLAIQQYQNMLEKDASLDYVRFDLGAMLFENRQYRQAEKYFYKHKTILKSRIISAFWQGSFSANQKAGKNRWQSPSAHGA